jgi:hypothetical protein
VTCSYDRDKVSRFSEYEVVKKQRKLKQGHTIFFFRSSHVRSRPDAQNQKTKAEKERLVMTEFGISVIARENFTEPLIVRGQAQRRPMI